MGQGFGRKLQKSEWGINIFIIAEILSSQGFQQYMSKSLPVAGLERIYNCPAKCGIKLFFCTLNAQPPLQFEKQ